LLSPEWVVFLISIIEDKNETAHLQRYDAKNAQSAKSLPIMEIHVTRAGELTIKCFISV